MMPEDGLFVFNGVEMGTFSKMAVFCWERNRSRSVNPANNGG